MRKQWLEQPEEASWTIANLGDTGDLHRLAMDLGADVENMDLCWWLPGTLPPDRPNTVHVSEAARPHAILVDSQGQRFTNEATSYVQIGINFYRHNREVSCIPGWFILDSWHRKRYNFGSAMPKKDPPEWLSSGFMKKADTIEELARLCDLPPDKLRATIERFNGFARQGKDEDFGRGGSAYAAFIGDPGHKPNPSLGPIEEPPYYAIPTVPGDVGTCGGLVTDEWARVLDTEGKVIPGLYATGNSTSSVHGPSYPGAGASIGASLAFGYVAARHAARANT
jgi:3-oxosteroid 1-dehydrogenase